MVVYHYEANCQAEKTVHYHQCQGHSEGLYNQNITIFTLSSKLLVCLQQLGFIVQHHKQSVLWKNWITAFKDKVTAKVQNVG